MFFLCIPGELLFLSSLVRAACAKGSGLCPQGTNAHVVVGESSACATWSPLSSTGWDRQVYWATIYRRDPTLQRFLLPSSTQRVDLEGTLMQPATHNLHTVALLGVLRLPTSSVLETALAAGTAASGNNCFQLPGLSRAAIGQQPQLRTDTVLRASIHLLDGRASITSPQSGPQASGGEGLLSTLLTAQFIRYTGSATCHGAIKEAPPRSSVRPFFLRRFALDVIGESVHGPLKSPSTFVPRVGFVEGALVAGVFFESQAPLMVTEIRYAQGSQQNTGAGTLHASRRMTSTDLSFTSPAGSWSISGVESKPAITQRSQERARPRAGTAMYQVVWQCSSTPNSHASIPGRRGLTLGNCIVPASTIAIAQGLYSMASTSMEVVSSGRNVLQTGGKKPSLFCIPGILRTTAVEMKCGIGGGTDFSIFCAGPTATRLLEKKQEAKDDPYGVHVEGMASSVPRMTSSVHDRGLPGADFTKASTYLITGGTGMIGGLVAAWLRTQHGVSVLLLGRSGRAAAESVLPGRGNGVLGAMSCDFGCSEDSATAMSCLNYASVGLMHAAGVLADATIFNQTAAASRVVNAPKVTGALNWQRNSASAAVVSQVLFSSVASLWGSPGQLQYAGANSVIDALSDVWRYQGCNSTCINWGAWSGGGMADSGKGSDRLRKLGLGMLSPGLGLSALGMLAGSAAGPATVAVTPVQWSVFLEQAHEGVAALCSDFFAGAQALEEQPHVERETHMPAANARGSLADTEHPQTSQSKDHGRILRQVLESVEHILGSRPDTAQPLTTAGLDSLGVVDLRNMLQEEFSVELPATVLYDYPTISDIAKHIGSLLAPPPSIARSSRPHSSIPETRHDDPGHRNGVVSCAHDTPRGAAGCNKPIDAVELIPASKWDIDAEMQNNLTTSGRCVTLAAVFRAKTSRLTTAEP